MKNNDGDENLFDYAEAQRRRDEGQQRAEERAAEMFIEGGRAAWRHVLLTHEYATADDLRAELPHYVAADVLARTHHNAIGAIFTYAMNHGWCEFTGDFQHSSRPAAHVRPLRIWRSLLYRGLKYGTR